MIVGVPRERRAHEDRVVLTPAAVASLVDHGHQVLVERGAGRGSGFVDDAYAAAGATLAVDDVVWGEADLVVKVKEPQPEEFPQLRPGLVLFCYLHLAAEPDLAAALVDRQVTAIAFETVTSDAGALPLLEPMSQIAGRLSTQVGASLLVRPAGGSGVLLGGATGVRPGRVAVVGAGVAGLAATGIAVGLGAEVTVIDIDPVKLARAEERWGTRVRTLLGSGTVTAEACAEADLVIGAVLVPGRRAPQVLDTATIGAMRPGSCLVDIAIDQGGCFEPSRPTSHAQPTIDVDGTNLYAVPNMPGSVPRTATLALSSRVLPYVERLAEAGWEAALADPHLARGLTVHGGAITSPEVDEALAGSST